MLMNKFLRLTFIALMAFIGSSSLLADEYTVTFKETGTDSDSSTKETSIEGLVASGGEIFSEVVASNAYQGRSGRGVKLGSSSNPGSMVFTLSPKLKIQTIKFKARKYGTGTETSITVNGKDFTELTETVTEYTVELNGAETEKISISTPAKRAYITSLTIITPSEGGGSGEGGGSDEGGNKETWTACEGATTTLKAAFSSVVNADGVATNETNGRSVVKVDNTALIFKAVGGAVPKDITPKLSVVVNEELHLFGIESISGWNDIKWTNGNNFGDDPENPMYFVNGTGNPFTKICSEEIYTDGKATGQYRTYYFYYEKDGSRGLPYTGVYYKFTPKASGKLKVGIWANKTDRKQFVVKESTMQAMDYKMEGYLNTQKYTADDAPTPELVGKMKKLTHEQLVELHNQHVNDEKAKEGGKTEEDLEYVIGDGSAFRGYLTIDVEKGEGYYFFTQTAQMGFCSYELTYEGDVDATIQEKDELAGLGDAKAIENIDISTGIEAITTKTDAINSNAQMYNLSGQKVDKSYKGIVIQNGRKFVNK